MAAEQNFVKRIEIRLNRSEVTNYLASLGKAPVPQPEGILTSKKEPRNEIDVFSVIVKTESHHNPEQEVVSSQVKGFNCPTCQLSFKFSLHLQHHQSTNQRCTVECNPQSDVKLDVDADNSEFNREIKMKHSCTACKKEFNYKSALRRHMGIHSNERPYICSTCNHSFKFGDDLKRHTKKEHKFKCENCELSFVRKLSFVEHGIKCHQTVSRKYFSCSECKKQFALVVSLRRHIATIHSNERQYVCSTCLHTFKLPHTLFEHSRKEHKFKCENCELSFVRKLSFVEHGIKCRQTESQKYFSCSVCRKLFTKKCHLKSHITYFHSNERPYICSTCQHSFKLRNDLKRHTKREHKYKCEKCELSFAMKLSVDKHLVKFHQAESRELFSCPDCTKQFKKYSHLCSHQKVHNKERPFVCPICQITFKWNHSLLRHIRRKHIVKCDSSSELMPLKSSIAEDPEPLPSVVTIKEELRPEDDSHSSLNIKTEPLYSTEPEVGVQKKFFQCPTCQLIFKYRLHLNHHQNTNQRCAVQGNQTNDVKLDNWKT